VNLFSQTANPDNGSIEYGNEWLGDFLDSYLRRCTEESVST
jgi:hypothetical protein